MNDEEANFIREQEANINNLRTDLNRGQSTQTQQAMLLEEKESSMIRDQIDLSVEIEMIEQLLKGKVLVTGDNGLSKWEAPEDKQMIILSDHGVHLIMNCIQFYLNKNTLLSNYDEETIDKKMYDFSTDLADTIFMEYEKVFSYPTFEDCKEVLEKRLIKKQKLREFAYKLSGVEYNSEEIKQQMIDELEGKIEKEIDKIREQIIKNKLKRFMIILREVQDAVHSTYLRAWKGQERRTLRQHIHVTESMGGPKVPQQQSRANPLNWFSKR